MSSRIVLICGLVVLLTAGGSLLVVSSLRARSRESGSTRLSAEQAIDSGYAAYTRLELDRYEILTLTARTLASDRSVRDFVAASPDGREGLRDQVLELLSHPRYALGFAAIRTPDGRVLVSTEGPATPSLPPLTRPEGSDGAWVGDGGLTYTVTAPIRTDLITSDTPAGHITVGLEMGGILPQEIRNISKGEVLFLAREIDGVRFAQGTLDRRSGEQVLSALGGSQGPLEQVLRRGMVVERATVEAAERPYLAMLAPVRGVEDTVAGAVVLLAPSETGREELRWAVLGTAAASALALVLAVVLAAWVSRAFAAPVRLLTRAVQGVRRGETGASQIARRTRGSGDVGALAAAVGGLLGDFDQERALREAVAAARGAVSDGAEVAAEPQEVALLGLELRRFVSARDRAAAEELRRELERIGRIVREHHGRLEAVLGHRVLAVFRGDRRVPRALAAAVELLDQFSEAGAPLVVLTSGRSVQGKLPDWPVMLGPPVQLLETLLREATPGEILLSREARRELEEAFQAARVEPRAQRGVITPQPLFVLSRDVAARVASLAEWTTGLLDVPTVPGVAAGRGAAGAGQVLGDRFEVVAPLGSGPEGTVVRALDRELGREVALKLFGPQALVDRDRLALLEPLRTLVHANVARTYDFGMIDGTPFLSRQLVEGASLRGLLEAVGPLPPAAALGAARQLAAGLAAAHREGVHHLRLKPENLLFDAEGILRITDFGVAAVTPGRAEVDSAAGGYKAPEQEAGEAGDGRSDVFACGLLLHRLFAGKVSAAEGGAGGVEGLPPGVDGLIRQCLMPEPDRRYRDAGELLAALEALELP